MNKSELLIKTSTALMETTDYRWSNAARCNIGHLIEAARGTRPTGAEFIQGGGCRLWSRRGDTNHIIRWLKTEYGLTDREIESIELLNDRTLVRQLARRGIHPAPLFNRSRKYVAAYLAAMARREKRRKSQACVPA